MQSKNEKGRNIRRETVDKTPKAYYNNCDLNRKVRLTVKGRIPLLRSFFRAGFAFFPRFPRELFFIEVIP